MILAVPLKSRFHISSLIIIFYLLININGAEVKYSDQIVSRFVHHSGKYIEFFLYQSAPVGKMRKCSYFFYRKCFWSICFSNIFQYCGNVFIHIYGLIIHFVCGLIYFMVM